MSTPTTPADDVAGALRDLDDQDLAEFTGGMIKLADDFAHDKLKLSGVCHAVALLGAEEQDRRAELIEHARVELDDGIGAGALLAEVDDPAHLWDGRE